MVNVELSENDLFLLRQLLMNKIEMGGKMCEIKRCIYLFDYFKGISSVETIINE